MTVKKLPELLNGVIAVSHSNSCEREREIETVTEFAYGCVFLRFLIVSK